MHLHSFQIPFRVTQKKSSTALPLDTSVDLLSKSSSYFFLDFFFASLSCLNLSARVLKLGRIKAYTMKLTFPPLALCQFKNVNKIFDYLPRVKSNLLDCD